MLAACALSLFGTGCGFWIHDRE
ncbi:hypothetical protein DENIT_70044 [Pseudomonas veronii]|nr:hypothetical protein DENIT_70044 [Pseudomonas veronii]